MRALADRNPIACATTDDDRSDAGSPCPMAADIGTAALVVGVIAVGALLPMYAKWRAMQALVDRLERRGLARRRREHAESGDSPEGDEHRCTNA